MGECIPRGRRPRLLQLRRRSGRSSRGGSRGGGGARRSGTPRAAAAVHIYRGSAGTARPTDDLANDLFQTSKELGKQTNKLKNKIFNRFAHSAGQGLGSRGWGLCLMVDWSVVGRFVCHKSSNIVGNTTEIMKTSPQAPHIYKKTSEMLRCPAFWAPLGGDFGDWRARGLILGFECSTRGIL